MLAETTTLWRALCLCAKLNIQKVVFGGDALGVIKIVNNKEECWEWHQQVIEDIKMIICTHPNWIRQHTYREGNRVAHYLTKVVVNSSEELVWIEDGPGFTRLSVVMTSFTDI